MYCGNCGKQLSDDAKFCPECGSPVESDTYDKFGEVDYADNYDYIDDEQTNISKSNKLAYFLGMIKDKYKSSKKLRIATLCVVAMLVVGSVGAVIINNFASSDGDGDSFVEELFNTKKRDDGIQFSTQCELYDCSNEYIIAESDNGKYGVLDFDGKEIIPFEYDKVEFADKNQKGDLFMVVKDDKCGVINYKNKSLIDRKYDAVGYFSDYDRVYTFNVDKKELLFFDSKGNKVGKANFSCDEMSVGFFTSYVCNDNIVLSTERYGAISVCGMLSSECVVLDDYGVFKFIDITNGDIVSNIDDGTIYHFIESSDSKYNYYRVQVTTYEVVPDKILPVVNHTNIIIDSTGKQVNEAVIKNSKGKELAKIKLDDYQYVRVLDDSGICLLRKTGGERILKNLKTDEVIAEFNYCYFDDENKILITNDSKIYNENESADIYTAYSYSGKKLYEYGDLYDLTNLYGAVDVTKLECKGSNGLFVSTDYNGLFRNQKFITSQGEVKDICQGGRFVSGNSYSYGDVRVYGNYYDGLNNGFSYKDSGFITKTSSYYSIENESGQYCVLNDCGDIIVDFGLVDTENTLISCNNSGICFKSGNDVYWYNRK